MQKKSFTIVFIIGFIALLCAELIEAATPIITRGPYFQLHRNKKTTIRYVTDISCDTVIRYGVSPTSLSKVVSNSTLTKVHSIQLTGLDTWKTYYYSIETSTQVLAKGTNYKFLSSPDDHHQGVLMRFWVVGDSGTGNANAADVRDAYLNFTGSKQTSLMFLLGNNALPSGSEANYDEALFGVYPSILQQTGLMPSLGEADTADSTSPPSTLPYFNLFQLPTGTEGGGVVSGTEKYFSYNYGIIHFVRIDTQGSDLSATGAMATWLKKDLDASTFPWPIAYFHHSPYSKGNHDSDSETKMKQVRENILPILESRGVDLVLSAHSNSYERSYLLDGHYGLSNTLTNGMILDDGDGIPSSVGGDGPYRKPAGANNAGAVYVVVGSSGEVASAPLNHPAMYAGLARLGSFVFDLKNNRLDAKFIDHNGSIADKFTLIKDNIAPSIEITSPRDRQTFTRPVDITLSANVTDPDTNIRWVEFRKGTTILKRVWAAPFTYIWTPQYKGIYDISVRAMDELGAMTVSQPVTITVN